MFVKCVVFFFIFAMILWKSTIPFVAVISQRLLPKENIVSDGIMAHMTTSKGWKNRWKVVLLQITITLPFYFVIDVGILEHISLWHSKHWFRKTPLFMITKTLYPRYIFLWRWLLNRKHVFPAFLYRLQKEYVKFNIVSCDKIHLAKGTGNH